MKQSDPLRALLRVIVQRHLPDEVELFDIAGDEVMAAAAHNVVLLPSEGGDAEFGTSAGDDVTFVAVSRAIADTLASIQGRGDVTPTEIAALWEARMHERGVPAAAAEAIARDHGAELLDLR